MLLAFACPDVSKDSLDCCLLIGKEKPKYRRFGNDDKGYVAMRSWAHAHSEGLELRFCMEATGCYHLGVATYLSESGEYVSVENPRRIKHFAIAANLKNKNDKVDSYGIARYAQALSPRRWVPKDEVRKELDAQRLRLKQLSEDMRRETNRLENKHLPELVSSQILAHIAFLESQTRQVESRVRELLASCESARCVYEAVVKITGAGPETALLMASLDIEQFESAKAVPVFFGMNPRQCQSGKYAGMTRLSKAGDAMGRALLTSAAQSASRHNEVFRNLFERLIARGLKRKQAIAAVARKLLMVAWGVARAALRNQPIYYPGGITPSRQAKKYCHST